MDYYYDLYINFLENYCMFYEWDEDDNLEYVKKIPLVHVDAKTYLNFRSKIVKVDASFLKTILNKTKLKDNTILKYAALVSDGKNSMALEFNDEGETISKSSLILDDEININEFMYNISVTKIDYEVIKKDKIIKETRQETKIKKILKLEILNMYQNKEYSKLKYIYLEWFDKLIDKPEVMYSEMLKKLKGNLGSKEYAIYELIKLSYNNV